MDAAIAVERMEYEQLTGEIKRAMRRSARDAVQLGFMLRRVMEERIWEAAHSSFDSYLQEELHMEYSLASRFIAINKRYSISGKSMDISPKYTEYSQGVLIEMLNMPPELEEKVSPEMTVREVREIKRQAKPKKEKPVPKQEGTEVVIDGEYREAPQETKEEVATSQPGSFEEIHDEYWFVRRYMEIYPLEAEGLIEVCRMEGNRSKHGRVIQEYIAPYGCHAKGSNEYGFDFRSFAKGLDMRVGVEKMHFAYNRFAAVLMEVAAGTENADAPNEEEEKLSPYGLPVTEYPEGSLLTTEGCGHKYDCIACAQDCGIRQKDRHCREAPLGNPFSCTTMEVLGQIKGEMGDSCQFISQERAYHRPGDNAADPCCKECTETCGYRCRRSAAKTDEGESSVGSIPKAQDVKESTPEYESAEAKWILDKERRLLNDYIEAGGIPEMTVLRQEIIVNALELMVKGQESGQEEIIQPELPSLKNTDQRKEWLRNYKTWGLWYRDENIDVNYYRYDFQDGSRLIVAEHPQRQDYWRKDARDEYFFHLLEKGKKGYGNTRYDEKYRNTPDSETYLVEFLKDLQKKRGGKHE